METIEEYEHLRLRYYIRYSISFIIWYGLFTYTFNFSPDNKIFRVVIISVEVLFGILFGIYIVKFTLLMKKIKNNKAVLEALSNEYYKHIALKSIRIALIAFLISNGIFLVILPLIEIPALLVCQLLLFIVVSSSFIAYYIYQKEGIS